MLPKHHGSYQQNSYDEQTINSTLSAKNNINITAAGQDKNKAKVDIQASNVTSKNGTINVNAANGITVENTTEEHDFHSEHHGNSKGFLSSGTDEEIKDSKINQVVGSVISADKINLRRKASSRWSNGVCRNQI